MIHNKKLTKRSFCILFLIIAVLMSTAIVFAEGDGSGNGENRDKPLALDSSVPANGAAGVAIDTDVVLTFTKNVVNMAVREQNKTCFTLKTKDGKTVPINVITGDDQIDPTIKRIIRVAPKEKLQQGTSYVLYINPLTAKNGTSMQGPTQISFTTKQTQAKAPAAVNSPDKNLNTPESTADTPVSSEDIDPSEEPSSIETEQNQEDDQAEVTELEDTKVAKDVEENNNNIAIIIIALIIIAAIALLLYKIKRRK